MLLGLILAFRNGSVSGLDQACNTGFEPLIRRDNTALRRSRLSWVRQNYIRAETLTRSNVILVAAQNRIPLARAWMAVT